MNCPKCYQNNYELKKNSFYFCGDDTKQCIVCGRDLPSNRCPSCNNIGYKKGICFSYTKGVDCPTCGKILRKEMPNVIRLPYSYNDSFDNVRYIEGWDSPNKLLVSFNGKNTVLSIEATSRLIKTLGLSPENIPGYKKPQNVQKETISLQEWEQYQRWKETRNELTELIDENLQRWKQFIDSITSLCPEFDEEIDEILFSLRKLPRIMRYIDIGEMPPMDLDDDDLVYYEEGSVMGGLWGKEPSYQLDRKRKTIVEIQIDDISDGKL